MSDLATQRVFLGEHPEADSEVTDDDQANGQRSHRCREH
ncbi:MAG: hypothetical protein JWP89_4305 [Schlesneria sp.]|nr:hypothetical protein [Schlesneria sp.]